MPICGLVLTLTEGCAPRRLEVELGRDARLTLGTRAGNRLPLVLETATSHEGADSLQALAAMPDILEVHVIRIDFSDEREPGENVWSTDES